MITRSQNLALLVNLYHLLEDAAEDDAVSLTEYNRYIGLAYSHSIAEMMMDGDLSDLPVAA